jgi:hypothetical protein
MPVILGGGLIDLKKTLSQGTDLSASSLIIGFTVAAISGYIAIVFLMDIVKRGKLHYFGIYCVAISILIIGYWQIMVPKLNYSSISVTAMDEKNPAVYNESAKEITTVSIGGTVKFRFSGTSGNYPVVDAWIIAPSGMTGKNKNRVHYDTINCLPAGDAAFVSEEYKVVPLESATIDAGGETREISIILRNSIGVEKETKVLMRVAAKNRMARIWGSGKVNWQ